MPKFAIGTALAYLVTSYDAYGNGGSWKSYLGAAGLVLSIIPFTLTAMKKTNGELHQEAKKETSEEIEASELRVKGLLGQWILLNLVRGLLPLSGTLLASVAFLRDAF